MLEFISNVLKCEQKKVNHRGGMGFRAGGSSGGMAQLRKKSTIMERTSELEDSICKDAEKAPADNDKSLAWKWDQTIDMFIYDGCDSKYKISEGGLEEHMSYIFNSLKKVEYYSIDDLNKFTQKKRCLWSAILGIPFLIFGCQCSFMYWDTFLDDKLKKRRDDIQKKLQDFQLQKLNRINPNLRLNISSEGGYIELKQVEGRRVVSMHKTNSKKVLQNPQHAEETQNMTKIKNISKTSLNQDQDNIQTKKAKGASNKVKPIEVKEGATPEQSFYEPIPGSYRSNNIVTEEQFGGPDADSEQRILPIDDTTDQQNGKISIVEVGPDQSEIQESKI